MRSIKDVSYDERVAAINKVVNGENATKVAKEFDITQSALFNLVQDFRATGHVRRPNNGENPDPTYEYVKITDEMKEDFARRFDQGENVNDIAKSYKLLPARVYRNILSYRRKNGSDKVVYKSSTAQPQNVHELLVEYVTQLKALIKTQVLHQIRGL